MNKKLIALAVASSLAMPVVSMAEEGEVKLYGRINNALDFVEKDSGGSSNVSNISSRIGVKANMPLGNGLTAHGRYEFSTFTDIEGESNTGNGGINDTRIGTVGLSGAFGRVDIGNQWSGFYNKVGTHIDPTYTLGYYLYSSFGKGPYRQSNAVKYSNSFGPVSLELDGRLSEDESSDLDREKIGADNGYGIALGIDPSENFYIGLAYDEQQDGAAADAERLAATLKANFGAFGATLSRMEYEKGTAQVDTNSLYLNAKAGSTTFSVGYLMSDDQTVEPEQVILGAYHNLGGGFKLYAEATSVDQDGRVDGDGELVEDFERYLAGMRFDF